MLQSITLFGQTINLYDFFNNASYFGAFLLALYVRRQFVAAAALPKLADMYWNKKKSRFRRVFFVVLNVLPFVFAVLISAELIAKPLSTVFLGKPDANFFPNIITGPIVVFLVAVLLRNSPLVTMDCGVMMISVSLIFFKIACFCWGCCNGVECVRFGIMNHNTGRVEFPVQAVELVCAVAMLVILMLLVRKKNRREGILYPLFMLMYCGSRFISEFWRDDYPDIFGPLKGYHILCIIGFVEGAVFLAVVLARGKRITAYFDERDRLMLRKHEEKLRAGSHNNKKRKS